MISQRRKYLSLLLHVVGVLIVVVGVFLVMDSLSRPESADPVRRTRDVDLQTIRVIGGILLLGGGAAALASGVRVQQG